MTLFAWVPNHDGLHALTVEFHGWLVVHKVVEINHASFALVGKSPLLPLQELLLNAALLLSEVLLDFLLDNESCFLCFFDLLFVLLVLRVFFFFLLLNHFQSLHSLLFTQLGLFLVYSFPLLG